MKVVVKMVNLPKLKVQYEEEKHEGRNEGRKEYTQNNRRKKEKRKME